jgi:hypothetical protein
MRSFHNPLLTLVVCLLATTGILTSKAQAFNPAEDVTLYAEQFVVEEGELAGQKAWRIPPFLDWSQYGKLGSTCVVMTTIGGAKINKWNGATGAWNALAVIPQDARNAVYFPTGSTLQPGDIVQVIFRDMPLPRVLKDATIPPIEHMFGIRYINAYLF